MYSENWKDIVSVPLQDRAQEALDNCDIESFIHYTDNQNCLRLLATVLDRTIDCDKLEAAFIDAFTSTRTNNYREFETIESILDFTDLDRLREQGDELPQQDEYRLYRGISGNQTPEIINGYSWTSNFELAHWFAMRFCEFGSPSVYTTTVRKDAILFYTNQREEDEFVLNPKKFDAEFLTMADQVIADKIEAKKRMAHKVRLAGLLSRKS